MPPTDTLSAVKRARRVADWPFAVKMAVCPLIAAVALLAMANYSLEVTSNQASLIKNVVYEDTAATAHLTTIAAHFQSLNARLYRLVLLQAVNEAKDDVGTRLEQLIGEASSLAQELREYGAVVTGEERRQQIKLLAERITTYGNTAAVLGSMLEIDFSSAVELVKPFDENARFVVQELSALAESAQKNGSARAAASALLASRARATTIIAIVTVLGAMIVFTGVITTATTRSVVEIARATGKIANGDHKLDISQLRRGDELGTIVRSLRTFQSNIAQVAFLAHHDPLTGLPNRALFQQEIEIALREQSGSGQNVSLFCLDLDHFKEVNDTLGHPVGDALLKMVAERITSCLSEQDTLARLGGDEFAIIVPNVQSDLQVGEMAGRVIAAVSLPYMIGGDEVNVGASIGISNAPQDGHTPEALLQNADTALYRSKFSGRGKFCFFESSMNLELTVRRQLELDLRQAMQLGELEVHYQPLVGARSRQIVGFEALVRWRSPTRGLVGPDQFIPLAEQTGLIVSMGEWVLGQACKDATSWPGCLKVAVNLSALQFKEPGLVQVVRNCLENAGLPAQRLELEITESILLKESGNVRAMLHEIRGMGVRICMDDFGTGYSSLSYLRSFPFDKIKIDRSFVRGLVEEQDALAIVRAIVGLSQNLGMSVTAEGVEVAEQAHILTGEECTELQGYLFSKPVKAADVAEVLSRVNDSRLAEVVELIVDNRKVA